MDESTLTDIVAKHRAFIRRTLSKLKICARDLADVEQEVVRGIHRGLARFDPARSESPSNAVRSWIFAICRRQAANHRRASAKRKEQLRGNDELDLSPGAEENGEQRLLEEERKVLLHRVLKEMNPGQRAVIVAYELEGIAMVDVARMLSIRVNTAWNRLRLAREQIRAAFRREDGEVP